MSRLWRHPALSTRTRPRSIAEEWIWLDSADGLLAADGRALRASPRGSRWLCPLMPGPGILLPGILLPGILLPGAAAGEEAPLPAQAVPEQAGSAALLPIASYAGRLSRSAPDASGVSVRLRRGLMRACTRTAPEQAVARLTLSGPMPAVLGMAAALAADLSVLPAPCTLDEEAKALHQGMRPRMRRRGAPDLGAAETAEDALALAIAHLTDVILAQAPLCRPELGPEGVHQARVAARRLRSCIKVFRKMLDGPALRALDAGLRDFARSLGAAREWDVFLRGLGADLSEALGRDTRWARLSRVAGAHRQDAYAALRAMLDGPDFRAMIWQAMRLAALRGWEHVEPGRKDAAALPLRTTAAAILTRRRRKLLKKARNIEALSDAELHELRLDAKRLRYAAELFAPLWPGKPAKRFLKRLSALQDVLGLSNDTVTARALVSSLAGPNGAPGWAIGLAEGWALAATRNMRAETMPAWRRFAKAKPFWQDG